MPYLSINPHNGELLNEYQFLSDQQIAAKLKQVSEATKALKTFSFSQKSAAFLEIAKQLRAKKETFAKLMALEMGKPIAQGRAEAEKCAWLCEYYGEHAESFLASKVITLEKNLTAQIQYHALGSVLAIMPWNFPFWQVFRAAVPAIMAGNAFILKHAPNVGGCALAIEELFTQTSLPENCFANFFADLKQTAGLIKQVSAVSLTGSTRAGREVAALAGRALKKVVLELGGSDPFIVLADADLELAVQAAVNSRLLNSGQSCIAAKRFIVADTIHHNFIGKLLEKLRAIQVGDPLDESNQVGPLARADLLEQAQGQLDQSLKLGAKIKFQSQMADGLKGFYYPPVLLENANIQMPCWVEETFAPTFVVTISGNEDEMVRIANESPYGLGGAIFSKDITKARALANRIEAGSVFINEMVKSDPRLPFGGIKDSGFGRELASAGIYEFTNQKTLYINPG